MSTLVFSENKVGCKNVILIDNRVSKYMTFYNSCNNNTFPIVYSTNSSKKDILNVLQNFNNIERLSLCFVNDMITDKMFLDNQMMLDNDNTQFIIELIKNHNIKNIDYLGCNTLNQKSWKNYYENIQNVTGVIVGASNDKTGNLLYGGNWIMESTNQDIKNIYFTDSILNYSSLLDVGFHSLVIKNGGTLYATGYNYYGELGFGNTNDVSSFTKVNTVPIGKKVQSTSKGYHHTMVLMTDGTLYATGYNMDGELGIGNTNDVSSLTPVNTVPTGKQVQSVSCGYYHTMVVMTDGTLYATGSNTEGQLGLGNTNDVSSLTPVNSVPTGKQVQSVSCGGSHTMVLMTDGTLYATGYNYYGQLGLGSNNSADSKLYLRRVATVPTGKQIQSVSCGELYTMVLMTDGTLYATGYNQFGQLGFGNINSVSSLTLVNTVPTGKQVQSVSCGRYHTMVLMTDGTLYATGDNVYGQLGIGINTINNMSKTSLTLVTTIPTGKQIQSVSCGYAHTMVLMTDGTLYAAGYNSSGQLGLGSNNLTDQPSFTEVIGVSGIVDTFIDVLLSNICFAAGSKVLTDQGLISIEKLTTSNSINNKNILYITKTYLNDKNIVCINKNALEKNIPNKKTLVSKNHLIAYNKSLFSANRLVGYVNGVEYVEYNGEILYNVLMEKHSLMNVNGLIAETLDPNNILAKIYLNKYTEEEKTMLLNENYKHLLKFKKIR